MESGKLNKQIDIQQVTVTQSSYGEPVMTYTSFIDGVWARVDPVAGREYYQSKLLLNSIDTRFTIRYTTDEILENMRVVYNDKNYNILSVINIDDANKDVVLMCNRVTT